jgi:hypothetical protein
MNWVREHSTARGSMKSVLMAIANHCRSDDTGSFPSFATIGAEAGVSRSTVIRSIQELERLGELQVIRGGGCAGRGGRTNLFRIVGPKEVSEPNPKRCQPDTASVERGVTMTPDPLITTTNNRFTTVNDPREADPVENEQQRLALLTAIRGERDQLARRRMA